MWVDLTLYCIILHSNSPPQANTCAVSNAPALQSKDGVGAFKDFEHNLSNLQINKVNQVQEDELIFLLECLIFKFSLCRIKHD